MPRPPTVKGNQSPVVSTGAGAAISSSNETMGQTTADTAHKRPRRASVRGKAPGVREGLRLDVRGTLPKGASRKKLVIEAMRIWLQVYDESLPDGATIACGAADKSVQEGLFKDGN